MSSEIRIQELVEKALELDLSAEDVCGGDEELLRHVSKRLSACHLMGAEIDALFPSFENGLSKDSAFLRSLLLRLPNIPGYEIEAVIGHGGAGAVYKARHLGLDRIVVIKMLLAGPFATTSELARFFRESKSLAALNHPNIVQVYDVGEVDGRPYYTMEYCKGGTLAQKLAGKPQKISDAVDLVSTLARSIHAAHVAGIVHRDLKPSNILLADGIPKISDFGLARQRELDSHITVSGARIGTPCYMSPEQASGSGANISTAVDIYALGVILYEMLTGRPPFLGSTAAETERQILQQDPIPPARMRPGIPRDLNTICLKCLAKNPLHRYAAVLDLAEDLFRFSRGRPIIARPIGHAEKLLKWCRRHPTAVVVILATLIGLGVAAIGAMQFESREVERGRAVQNDLAELGSLEEHADWSKAQNVLDRAKTRLDFVWSATLHQQVDDAEREMELVKSFDDIRLSRITNGHLNYYRVKADRDYSDLFAKSGLARFGDPLPETAARIQNSRIYSAIISALDDWAVASDDPASRRWILNLVQKCDPDPSGWREKLRDPDAWANRSALKKLVAIVPVQGQSISTLLALAERFRLLGGDSRQLLQRVQNEHPDDFWANLSLGSALLTQDPAKAEDYFRTALGARPSEAVGYVAVGDALRNQQLPDDAIRFYQKALQLDKNCLRAENNIGLALTDEGRSFEAMDYYEHALNMDNNYCWAHFDLANNLKEFNQIDDATEHYKAFLAAEPGNIPVQIAYRGFLVAQGHGDEVLQSWRDSGKNSVLTFSAWAGYPELCLYLGNEDEYRRARNSMLRSFGQTNNPAFAEQLARACLLTPASPDELNQAVSLVNLAVAAKLKAPAVAPYFLFSKGLAQYRQKQFGDAITTMRGDPGKVLGPCPQLIIAMAQNRQGNNTDAVKTLASAVMSFDWRPSLADRRDIWIYHILRRESEGLILSNLPAFLNGDYHPQNNDERLALMGICQFSGRHSEAARMYLEAFADDPSLFDDPVTDFRYKAACAACMAAQTPVLDPHWRRQALAWLESDFAHMVKATHSSDSMARTRVREQLRHWLYEPDLAGLRMPAALQNMSVEDRAECQLLWGSVHAVIAQWEAAK